MWNKPTTEELAKVPKLYETEHVPLQDKTIHLHFFIGGCDWFIAETDGVDIMWGFAILNGDMDMAEWGYISLNELSGLNVSGIEVDFDLYWQKRPACEVEKIRQAQGWCSKEAENGIHSETQL